jgi:hypothetical protein
LHVVLYVFYLTAGCECEQYHYSNGGMQLHGIHASYVEAFSCLLFTFDVVMVVTFCIPFMAGVCCPGFKGYVCVKLCLIAFVYAIFIFNFSSI